MNNERFWNPSFRDYCLSLEGRVGGMEYFLFGVASGIVSLLAGAFAALVAFLSGILGFEILDETVFGVVAVALLALIVPTVSMTVKRLHDWGLSAGWLWILLIPVASLALWFVPGTSSPNKYGPRSWESYATRNSRRSDCRECGTRLGCFDRFTQPDLCKGCWTNRQLQSRS